MKTKYILIVAALAIVPIVILAQAITVPAQFIKTVTDASIPEQVTSTNNLVRSVTFIGIKAARTANVGTVYIGFTSANDTQIFPVTSGGQVVLTAPETRLINLSNIWIDVVTAGDGVGVTTIKQ